MRGAQREITGNLIDAPPPSRVLAYVPKKFLGWAYARCLGCRLPSSGGEPIAQLSEVGLSDRRLLPLLSAPRRVQGRQAVM
jgi:hypothetical protein